jgi:hypothetical protein
MHDWSAGHGAGINREEPISATVLLPPLQRLEFVAQERIARRTETFIHAGRVKGIACVPLVEAGVSVVTKEMNPAQRPIAVNLADDATDAMTRVR